MFKLRNVNIKYIVKEEEKLVVSLVSMAIVNVHNNKVAMTFTCQGLSKCSPEDTFDVVSGKRLARAKAEKKAYIKFAAFLKDFMKRLDYLHSEVMANINKNNNCIDHQTSYIKENF